MWLRCKFKDDLNGMYITPLIGFSSKTGDKSFWFGWLWWLWEFRLTKRAADGWLGSAFDAVLSVNGKLKNFFASSPRSPLTPHPLGGSRSAAQGVNVKITIDLPDELHKALKSDFAAQVISEKFLGLELSASSKVARLVLQAAQQSVQSDGACQHANIVGRDYDFQCVDCGAINPHRR